MKKLIENRVREIKESNLGYGCHDLLIPIDRKQEFEDYMADFIKDGISSSAKSENGKISIGVIKTAGITLLVKFYEPEEYCKCGNPSKEGNVHFEGDEKLIYTCSDCGKVKEFDFDDEED